MNGVSYIDPNAEEQKSRDDHKAPIANIYFKFEHRDLQNERLPQNCQEEVAKALKAKIQQMQLIQEHEESKSKEK